jgi:hypothetical protein
MNCDKRRENKRNESCFVGDESRPLEIGIQVQVSNYLLVLQSKAVVLSVTGKG